MGQNSTLVSLPATDPAFWGDQRERAEAASVQVPLRLLRRPSEFTITLFVFLRYDPATNTFIGASRAVNDLLNTSDVQKAIAEALRFLGEQ